MKAHTETRVITPFWRADFVIEVAGSEDLITHRYSLEEIEEAYRVFENISKCVKYFLPEIFSPICPKKFPINDGFCIFAKIRILCQTISHA